MATTNFTFGMGTGVSGYVSSIEVSKKLTDKMIVDKDGSFAQAHAFDPSFSLSIRGGGSSSDEVAASTITGITANTYGAATVMITTVRYTEKADDWDTYEVSAIGYPTGCTIAT
jgi:hypothetical protein